VLSYKRLKETARQRVKSWLTGYRGYRLHDLPGLDVRLSDRQAPPRINLVILGIRKQAIFGGADTALRFFKAMQAHFPRARIIVLKEDEKDLEPAAWGDWVLESQQPEADRTIAFMREDGFEAAIEPGDLFIATHWLTAYFVQRLQRRLADAGRPALPYIYLIQDFEPGFYPWSGRYLVASGTYSAAAKQAIAVFNTKLLQQFVEHSGYRFATEHIFEPRLNPGLAKHQPRLAEHAKRRLLLVYGRPGTARNAFDLVLETLLVWAKRYPNASKWELLSLGEQHRDLPLGQGMVLRSNGKSSLDGYATRLLDASVGLSLMVSPHPSYPPLEMAEFGVRVVTNNFANKDLSHYSRNITSLADSSPDALADALIQACEAHERGEKPASSQSVFLGGAEEFPFAGEIAAQLIGSLAA
jgi:O-antigen biosynthesis protein